MDSIWVLLKKDFKQFTRNKIYSILSLVGLILFIVVFWILPDTIDESISLGIVHHDLGELISSLEEEEGVELVDFSNEQSLGRVLSGEGVLWRMSDGELLEQGPNDKKPKDARKVVLAAGVVFPPDFLRLTAGGQESLVKVLINDDTPTAIRAVLPTMVREITFAIVNVPLPITVPNEQDVIIGVDRLGSQVSIRERMRPMLAFFVLMMETFALSSLIADEISKKTVVAVLATPATVQQVLVAKTIFGALLALSQAIVLLVAVQGFTTSNWHMLLVATILGALMFSSIAMLVGSWGKDFLENLFLVMLFIIPLMIPAINALFPGSAPTWIRFVPSYGIMQTLLDVTAYGAAWGDILPLLGMSALWTLGLMVVGLFVLRRKVVRL
jgi:ABC-2 type transport system permease protein